MNKSNENIYKTKLDNNNSKINNNSKTNLTRRITKDTIFEKENLDPNLYNTISSNLGHNNKSRMNNIIKDIKNNRNIDKKNKNVNQTMNTIIFRKNNSELLTFGNTNDSLSDSCSKTSNMNKNYLLLLKQENESLKKELMKTKQKVDVLENKIELLINENYNNNNMNNNNKKKTKKLPLSIIKYQEEQLSQLINDKSENNKKKENNNGKTNNKVGLKQYQSQKYLDFNNDKKDNNKNNNCKNVKKSKCFGRTFSSILDLEKNKKNNKINKINNNSKSNVH